MERKGAGTQGSHCPNAFPLTKFFPPPPALVLPPPPSPISPPPEEQLSGCPLPTHHPLPPALSLFILCQVLFLSLPCPCLGSSETNSLILRIKGPEGTTSSEP